MANLIITVISIALVAVAALMSAYYGGSAFMDGQAKATVNTVLAQSEQIKGAYMIYLANGNTPIPHYTVINGSDPLTANGVYLQSVPIPPSSLNANGNTYIMTYGATTGSDKTNSLQLYFNNPSICEKMNEVITGDKEVITNGGLDSHGRNFSARYNQYGAFCSYSDNNGNGVPDGDGEIQFFYRIR